jgi:endonuclease/exonuclease/phosphatase family metal-dependent hydrolase
MPDYSSLRVRPEDDAATQTYKRRVAGRLVDLRTALASHLWKGRTAAHAGEPLREEGCVRIATWNLREFGRGSYGGRLDESYFYIAEVISHFDLVAVQEVRADLRALARLMHILGHDWQFVATDVTDGDPGNGERMAFVFNRSKVRFRRIAGELTLKEGGKVRAAFGERIHLLPGAQLALPAATDLSGTYEAHTKTNTSGQIVLDADLEIDLPAGCTLDLPQGGRLVLVKGTPIQRPSRGHAQVQVPAQIANDARYRVRFPPGTFDDSLRQFARTPFLVAFQAGWLKLNLCTVHIYYGEEKGPKLQQRKDEISLLTKALAGKAAAEFAQDRGAFLGVLGDFNILGAGHPTMQALESHGFEIPAAIKELPAGSNVERDKAYDQIAFWKPGAVRAFASLDVKGAGIFDVFDHVFTNAPKEAAFYTQVMQDLHGRTWDYRMWRTYQLSDHLPLWVELRTDFGEDYLRDIG